MTKSRGILRPRRVWTPPELKLLRRLYPTTLTAEIAARLGRPVERVYAKANALGLKKAPEHLELINTKLRAAMLDPNHPSRRFQFPKGLLPWNKGQKGLQIGGVETQFKAGHRPHTWRPIGSDRVSKEGYLQVKLADTGCTRRDYVPVHHLVWTLHRGPIPAGYRVTFKDGNKTHIAIDNLELVSIADMMRRNTVHNLPKPLAEVVLLRGALKRKINRIERKTHERDEREHC